MLFRSPALQAVTIFLLLLKLIGTLRALEKFGFLVSMLVTTTWMMKDFVLLFSIFVGGFAFIFTVLLQPQDGGAADGGWLVENLWTTYLLAVMGDFDADVYTASSWATLFFFTITFVMNIILLNVLISIVGEGYGLAQTNRVELGRRQCAGLVCDLEATYLFPLYSEAATRRGYACRLVRYPQWLLTLSRWLLGARGEANPKERLKVVVPGAFEDEASLAFTRRSDKEFTERAMFRRIGEDMTAQLAELRAQIADLAVTIKPPHTPRDAFAA